MRLKVRKISKFLVFPCECWPGFVNGDADICSPSVAIFVVRCGRTLWSAEFKKTDQRG